MSDSINEQRCKHGCLTAGLHYDQTAKLNVPCLGPSVVTPPAQDGPLCYWTGHDCLCGASAVMSYEQRRETCHGRRVPVPAAPSVSTDHTDERRAALTDLEHALTLALQAMADNDCCADPDDPDWRGPAIEQFRRDLIALGVTADELDECGISEAGHG